MKIEKSEIKDLTGVITMVVEPSDYQDELQKELKQVRQKANIPGFRPGMVPLGLVKKMYGKGILAEVLNKTVGSKLGEYIENEKLQLLGEPLSNDSLTPAMDLDSDDTFTFAFDIALAPEFDAKLTAKDKLTYYNIKVTDEMVGKQVESYANRFGEYVDAEEYANGDILRGTMIECTDAAEPVKKEGAVLNPAYMQDKKTAKLFIGKKKGEEVKFNPMAAYNSEVEVSSLLGISKEAAKELKSEFTFTIEGITRHIDAKIDSALFAKVYGEGNVNTEEEFRAKVRAEIEENMTADSDYKFGLDVKNVVMKKMEGLAFPDDFLKRRVLATNEKMTPEKLDADYPRMLDELKWQLAKDQLMKQFDVKVEKQDVEAYAKEVAKMQFMQYGLTHVEDKYLQSFADDMLKNEDQLRGLIEHVAENKIYAASKQVVKLENKSVSHDDFGKMFTPENA